jgi:hypothetical protein
MAQPNKYIHRDKSTNIDSTKTFVWFLGFVVKQTKLLKGCFVVEERTLKDKQIHVVWRDTQSSDEPNELFIRLHRSVKTNKLDTICAKGRQA